MYLQTITRCTQTADYYQGQYVNGFFKNSKHSSVIIYIQKVNLNLKVINHTVDTLQKRKSGDHCMSKISKLQVNFLGKILEMFDSTSISIFLPRFSEYQTSPLFVCTYLVYSGIYSLNIYIRIFRFFLVVPCCKNQFHGTMAQICIFLITLKISFSSSKIFRFF